MRFGLVVFPGSNCDQDCDYVLKNVLGQKVSYIWHEAPDLSAFDVIILPGGFSYGDYLRAGAIARFSPVMKALPEFIDAGKLVVGICNGFQILLEAKLLPGVMLVNKNLHFICKYVHIRVENNQTPITNMCTPRQILKIPIAHNQGNYLISTDGLSQLKENNQIVFRYCDSQGHVNQETNPNGSLDNIAGICNGRRNVFGLMPHPERASESFLGSEDGRLIFISMINWLKENA